MHRVIFAGFPVVVFTSGLEVTIVPERWSVRVGSGKIASRRQLPLKLAWAISIHKSQVWNVSGMECIWSGMECIWYGMYQVWNVSGMECIRYGMYLVRYGMYQVWNVSGQVWNVSGMECIWYGMYQVWNVSGHSYITLDSTTVSFPDIF